MTYPEGDHGGKVERCDASAHTQRLSEGVGVHVFAHRAQSLPELEGCDGAGMLNNLCMCARWRRLVCVQDGG